MSVTASLDLLLSLLKPKPTQTEIDEWWSTVDSIAAGIDSFGKKGKTIWMTIGAYVKLFQIIRGQLRTALLILIVAQSDVQ